MSADPRHHPNGPEIETIPALDAALASGHPLRGLRLQDLDLTGHQGDLLGRTDVEGMVVLGGRLSRELEEHLRTHHALIFPSDPPRPGQPLPRDAVPAARAVRRARGAGLRADAGRRGLPLVPRRPAAPRRLRHPAAGDPRRLRHRRADRVHRCPPRRRRDGRSRAGARHRGGMPWRPVSATPWRREGLWSPPAAAPGRWRPPTSGRSARRMSASTTPWRDWQPCRPSDPTSPRGQRWPSRSTTSSWRRDGRVLCPASASPPGSTATSRPTSSATRSGSTSPTPSARTACSPGARPVWWSSRARRARSRRSSRPRPGCTTRLEEGVIPPLVLVGDRHWRRHVPVWDGLQALARGRGMASAVHLVDDISEVPALLRS